MAYHPQMLPPVMPEWVSFSESTELAAIVLRLLGGWAVTRRRRVVCCVLIAPGGQVPLREAKDGTASEVRNAVKGEILEPSGSESDRAVCMASVRMGVLSMEGGRVPFSNHPRATVVCSSFLFL